MRLLCKENSVLNDKVQQVNFANFLSSSYLHSHNFRFVAATQTSLKQKRMPCGKGKGPCPADIEYRLNEYSETTKLLVGVNVEIYF
jgi:hypothetical protein